MTKFPISVNLLLMFKQTSILLKNHGITRPTLVVLEERVRRNIHRMATRAAAAGVVLRPHFKTHQSVAVGRWFAAAGIDRIAVSSVTMAAKFAAAGWRDITVAFLINPLELPRLTRLAADLAGRGGSLGITLDSSDAARALVAASGQTPAVWLKIDTGYHRTGIPWDDCDQLNDVALSLKVPPVGLLTHAGQSYQARGATELQVIWQETLQRLQRAQEALGRPDLLLSVGDTPTCGTVQDLSGVDEIRPGNFAYFDLMQLQIGSCASDDLAAAAACPVVGIYPQRRQVVIHGGAVHFSKETIKENGLPIFGKPGLLEPGSIVTTASLTGQSQEHGIITFAEGTFPAPDDLTLGDLLLVWPVHSCLTANLLGEPTILS